MLPEPEREVGPAPLAVLMRGKIPNAYPEGDVPPWQSTPDSLRTTEPVEEFVPVDSAVMVVGCSKMFEDSFLQMVPGNGMLLLNAVDALTLGDDLIEIRAKVTTARTLRPISDQLRLLLKFVVVGLIPLAIAVFGVGRQLRRRREEARFLAAQTGGR
jgi:ABC-type uncharacterized transport system involved in gliding motility auxiliary subunit